jgi:vitamin K-dependent gamma-carboxylase
VQGATDPVVSAGGAVRAGRAIRIRERAVEPVSAASVAVLRIGLGLVLAWSMFRYLSRGWVTTQLTGPEFHVHYPGFSWVAPVPAPWMHLVLVAVGVAGVALALGWHQRANAAVALVGFVWIELIDAATYLNHYELVTLLLAWAVVLPMNRAWSLDRRAGRAGSPPTVDRWVVWTLRAQVAVVYVFAGLAKLTPDWLLHGEPLGTWLAARSDLPIVGSLLTHPSAGTVASWGGALFDLTVVGLLCWRRSRPFAYAAVVVFHLVTWRLFPAIGVFPLAMILLTPIFFDPAWPLRPKPRVKRLLQRPEHARYAGWEEGATTAVGQQQRMSPWVVGALAAVALLQVVVPLRHLAEGGDVRWDEVGYRWSWRVMLTERSGVATFDVVDPVSGEHQRVSPAQALPPHQARYVSSRPEALRQFAHWLADQREEQTGVRPAVHATAWVSVNGSRRTLIVDPNVDLAAQPFSAGRPTWILPAPPDL